MDPRAYLQSIDPEVLAGLQTPTNAQYKPLPQPAQSTAPLVLVEGFLSYTSEFFWGDFETHLNAHRVKVGSKKRRHIIFARVGPVNSAHDRACELYYSIRGGTVDYGEEHAKSHGHGRYGRNHSIGLYPSWSKDHPLHFLGHSMGGVTIAKLMAMIRDGFFGPDAHPDMMSSITSVMSPFRGTQLNYSLTGSVNSSPSFGPLSFSSFLSKYLHTVSYFAPILPASVVPDFHNESRKLSMKDISLRQYLGQLWHSDWSEGKDATPWDCTFAAAEERDEEFYRGGMGEKTWYRSYVATMTDLANPSDTEKPFHTPSLAKILTSAPLYVTSFIMGAFDFSTLKPLPRFMTSHEPTFKAKETGHYVSHASSATATVDGSEPGSSGSSTVWDEEDQDDLVIEPNPEVPLNPNHQIGEHYWANDGVVPLFSQWHPGPCSAKRCNHHPSLAETARLPTEKSYARAPPQPGIWNVIHIENSHHLSLMPFWIGSTKQRTFWYGLGEWLEEVDAARTFQNIRDGTMSVCIERPPFASLISGYA